MLAASLMYIHRECERAGCYYVDTFEGVGCLLLTVAFFA